MRARVGSSPAVLFGPVHVERLHARIGGGDRLGEEIDSTIERIDVHTKFWPVKERFRVVDFNLLENSGLYWHIVDIIWIFLFPLFYLIT